MSQSKKEEGNNRSFQLPAQNNPFSSYVANNPHSPYDRESASKKRYRQKSYSSEKSSRSRSREKRLKDKKYESSYAKYESPNEKRSHERRDYRDRGHYSQLPKKEEVKDEAYFKTKPCPLFEKGQCMKGSACSFAHGEKQLRGLPNFKKTRLCIPFKNGECFKSSADCKYAHGQSQLRKLAYDYFPQKNHESARYERNDRDRDRDRGYRERNRDYEGNRDRYKDRHYPSKDQSRNQPTTSQDPSKYPPQGYAPYMSSYNSAYMIPPSVAGYGQSGQLYPPAVNPHSSTTNSSNYASMPPNVQGQGPYPPPLYNMGSYEYGFGYPHNYPPFNPSSV